VFPVCLVSENEKRERDETESLLWKKRTPEKALPLKKNPSFDSF